MGLEGVFAVEDGEAFGVGALAGEENVGGEEEGGRGWWGELVSVAG